MCEVITITEKDKKEKEISTIGELKSVIGVSIKLYLSFGYKKVIDSGCFCQIYIEKTLLDAGIKYEKNGITINIFSN